jgi:NTE family protein
MSTTPRSTRITRRTLAASTLVLAISWWGLSIAADATVSRYRNVPLEAYDPDRGYRFERDDSKGDNKNDLFVVLSLSGGGTRAAALAYGVLCELRDTRVEWKGRSVSLLDEVDVISSVSGGSFIAAYYGLFRDETFTRFEEDFLRVDFQSRLSKSTFSPLSWFHLASLHYDRIDRAGEVYGEDVFRGMTFADLRARSPRPLIVLNATNVLYGSQFSFTQDFFDFIGSDLDPFPIGRAVAASSAFPILLSPMTLDVHARPKGFEIPQALKRGLEYPRENRSVHAIARTLAPYDTNKDEHPYLHLLDGGLSDNLGLRFVMGTFRTELDVLQQRDPPGDASRIERLLVIAVNARNEPAEDIDMHPDAPGPIKVGLKAATASMDNFSFETVELMRDKLLLRAQAQKEAQDSPQLAALGIEVPPPVDSAVVEVSLYDIPSTADRATCLADRLRTLAPANVSALRVLPRALRRLTGARVRGGRRALRAASSGR